MIKKYNLQLPLNIDDSFELVRKSGDEVASWGANNVSPENHYLEWKQSFWALSGSTLISVALKPSGKKQTAVTVMIHKPLQVIDPIGICYGIYRKLEKSIQKNLDGLESADH